MPILHAFKPPPDLNVRLAKLAPDREVVATKAPDLFRTQGGAVLQVPGVARYEISHGGNVTIEIAENADMALLRLFFLGSVMGFACHQRGLMALHASAVSFDDSAIAFCGPPGMGKSTLAAFCVAAGARLVADDVLVVSYGRGTGAMANPGVPKFKLWRDALESLGRTTDGLSPDWARADKFHLPADQLIVTEPVRLSQILILDDGEDSGVGTRTVLSGAEAVTELIQNTYRAEYLDIAQRRSAHFIDCVKLATLTPVVRLRRRRDKASLMETARMLVDNSTKPP
jgi:hypothetical protein